MGKLLSVLGVLVFCSPSFAAPAPRFGPEFSFTSSTGKIDADDFIHYINRLTAHLVESQPEAEKFTREDRTHFGSRFPAPFNIMVKFTSPNGWWLDVGEDDGVIEVKMGPMTVEEFKRYQSDIQDAIFTTAGNAGYFPWLFQGGGHINMSADTFGDDLMLARNFVVDYWNHNELSMGIMNYDTHNAISFSLAQDEVREKVQALIAKVDAGEYEKGVGEFLQELSYAVGRLQNEFSEIWKVGAYTKLVDLHLGHAGPYNKEKQRVEIRAVRPQASVDVWIRQISLFEGRVNFLRGIRWPIPFRPLLKVQHPLVVSWDVTPNHLMNPPVDPQLALRAFYRYVVESGQEWTDHRDYLWPRWLTEGEVDKFEASPEFRLRERLNAPKRAARLRKQTACETALL